MLNLCLTFQSEMKIPATKHTPLVEIDEAAYTVKISGVCIPENAYVHFKSLEAWLNTLTPDKVEEVGFTFRLEYMNTLSSKAFLDYLRNVKDQKQIALKVIWEYYSDDEEMRDHGETFSEITDIPFEYRVVDPEDRRISRN